MRPPRPDDAAKCGMCPTVERVHGAGQRMAASVSQCWMRAQAGQGRAYTSIEDALNVLASRASQ